MKTLLRIARAATVRLRVSAAALALTWLAAPGCGGAPSPDPSPNPPRGPDADALAQAPAEPPSAGPSRAWPTVIFPGGDPGIGAVQFASLWQLAPGAADTLVIRQAPADMAGIIARFVLSMGGNFHRYEIVAGGDFVPNLLEIGYEESGVPVDSVTEDGSWARLIWGHDAAGSALRGWSRVDGEHTEVVIWRELLGRRGQFFVDDARIVLHESPGGARLTFGLAAGGSGYPSRYDYHLEADSAAGNWARVRVVTPSDACGEEPVGGVRDTVAWTRSVDERGRPLLWYFTRGC